MRHFKQQFVPQPVFPWLVIFSCTVLAYTASIFFNLQPLVSFPHSGLFLTLVLALLWIFDEPANVKRTLRPDPAEFRERISGMAEVFVQSILLLGIAQRALRSYVFLNENDILILGLFPLAYLFCRIRKGKLRHFLSVFGLSAVIFYRARALALMNQAEILLGWIIGLGLLQIAGAGILHRMKFSRPPKCIAGRSLFLILFVVLAAALQTGYAAFPPFAYLESLPAPDLSWFLIPILSQS